MTVYYQPPEGAVSFNGRVITKYGQFKAIHLQDPTKRVVINGDEFVVYSADKDGNKPFMGAVEFIMDEGTRYEIEITDLVVADQQANQIDSYGKYLKQYTYGGVITNISKEDRGG